MVSIVVFFSDRLCVNLYFLCYENKLFPVGTAQVNLYSFNEEKPGGAAEGFPADTQADTSRGRANFLQTALELEG